jgi:hypothetical protein
MLRPVASGQQTLRWVALIGGPLQRLALRVTQVERLKHATAITSVSLRPWMMDPQSALRTVLTQLVAPTLMATAHALVTSRASVIAPPESVAIGLQTPR